MDATLYLNNLRRYAEERDFAGYDPYDALNSPILRALTFGRKWPRILFIQALRRLPFNIRPLLLIRPGQNPKALGLFLGAYARMHQLDPRQGYEETIDYLIQRLAELKAPSCSGNGWGYNFDWQSRAFFLPRFTPTIVNSAFIGHALLDAYDATGNPKALALAEPISDFMLTDLNRIRSGSSFCFSYTPRDFYAVHNANVLGASLLIRLHYMVGGNRERDAALSSLAYTMERQRDDGSWFYSEQQGAHWVDSFHTGFTLEGIRYFLSLGYASAYRLAYERGVRYYSENFFLSDGAPKYYSQRALPFDIHSAAEAVSFFSQEGREYRGLTQRVLEWMLKTMYDRRGYFYYQQTQYFMNRIPYMRWSQAWAFRALAQYMWAVSRQKSDATTVQAA